MVIQEVIPIWLHLFIVDDFDKINFIFIALLTHMLILPLLFRERKKLTAMLMCAM